MPVFSYKGRNARGELVQGTLEAGDSGAIADQLFNTGITPVEIKSGAAAVAAGRGIAAAIAARFAEKITLTDLMLFCRQMYTLIRSGVPMLRALGGLRESATNPALGRVIHDLQINLDAGRELSAGMRRHTAVFSPFVVNMVRVGEMTGRLEEIFLRLAEHLEFENEMRGRIKTALRYPLLVVGVMAAALAIVNVFVIPAFAQIYDGFGAKLPLLTRVLIGFSEFTVQYGWLIVAAAIAGWMAFRTWIRAPAGRYRWDRFKLRIPIAGKIVLKATLARFARSFALTLKSGVPLVQSLTVVAAVVENDFVGQRIEQMRDGVERGESIARTAATAGVFTPVVLQMVAVGDETGQLDEMLAEVAQMYERDVEYDLKNLSTQIEPILIIALAALVLILALGVLMPIWGLGKAALGAK
ncbi:MAG: type II secretion system F family protein [Burkholderiales bacterium]|nr:type II secretion system F family protein [Burkholderiales bacterium]